MMKLAVIDPTGNFGGASRVVRALLPALKQCDPKLEIVYFGSTGSIDRENTKAEFSKLGIQVCSLRSTRLVSQSVLGVRETTRFFRYAQIRFRKQLQYFPAIVSGHFHREIEKQVRGFDVAYFPWIYFLKRPQLDCPCVVTFQDFNFKYYFSGQNTFNVLEIETMEQNLSNWIRDCIPIFPSKFTNDEFNRFYPDYSGPAPRIIHYSSMSSVSRMSQKDAENLILKFRLPKHYLLYPTNICSHKNIGPLISALPLLKKRGHDIPLVLCGQKTELVNGKATDIGVQLDPTNRDVYGLGYVSNQEADALIRCATVVVSSSLYEAGNGPGLDAWMFGVPVAMSNIPSFVEHLDTLGVKAEVFDPRSPLDIADKIAKILEQPEKAAENARVSMENIRKYTWKDAASSYLEVFSDAVSTRTKNNNPGL